MHRLLASCVIVGCSALTGSCTFPTIIDVPVGPFQYQVTSDRVMIPMQFQDTSSGTIATLMCQDDSQCPQLGAGKPAVHCVANACDPDPFVFELATNAIDLNMNATVQRYGDHVNSIAVTDAHVVATNQGLLLPVGPTELYWGPESAVDTNSPGVYHFGTIPVVQAPAGGDSGDQQVALDSAGSAALSDYLVHTSRTLKLFARPSIDVGPGTPLPSGMLTLALTISVHIEGQLVR
jgi:hypothetical protein